MVTCLDHWVRAPLLSAPPSPWTHNGFEITDWVDSRIDRGLTVLDLTLARPPVPVILPTEVSFVVVSRL